MTVPALTASACSGWITQAISGLLMRSDRYFTAMSSIIFGMRFTVIPLLSVDSRRRLLLDIQVRAPMIENWQRLPVSLPT